MEREPSFIRILAGIFVAVLFFIGVTSVLFGSWYTIDQGERGVVLRNGAIVGIAEPGLGFKMPWIDSVPTISTQSHKKSYEGELGLAAYSRDQQPGFIDLSVNYRADPTKVDTLYERYGTLDNAVVRLIDPQIFEHAKAVFGQYNAETAIQQQIKLNIDIEEAVQAGVGDDTGIIVESVQVSDINFSDAYEDSVEARMLAEVEVQKLRQNAEREKVQAEIAVIQANATADSLRATAQAEADAIRLRAEANGEQARLLGEGQADAIKARGAALANNPSLIALTTAENWDGKLPATMPPNGTVPFLDLLSPLAPLRGTVQ